MCYVLLFTQSLVHQEVMDETITVRRATLQVIVDSVERASTAAKHAVKISSSARDAFEKEQSKLDDIVRQLQRLADRHA